MKFEFVTVKNWPVQYIAPPWFIAELLLTCDATKKQKYGEEILNKFNDLPNDFSDVIEDNHSGNYWKDYYKYLYEKDNYTFYWDKELFLEKKKEIKNLFYQPHFVNTEVYKNFNPNPHADIMFAGRLDTDFRLNTMLDLMKTFEDKVFHWYAIERHFIDAKSRCQNEYEQKLLEKNYQGFISTETQMAEAINNAKICFNFNGSQFDL